MDQLLVYSIKCVFFYYFYQKCSCSLVVVVRGFYVFWCFFLIFKAGLNVYNFYVIGFYFLSIVFMIVDKQNGTVYICFSDGKVRQLIFIFIDVVLKFEYQLIKLLDVFGSVRIYGIVVSFCGVYLVVIIIEGMVNGFYFVNKNYQVQFVIFKIFEEVVVQFLEFFV